MSKKSGIVKFFNETKGFGFITDNESSKDVFVHKSATKEQLYENDKVEYDIETGDRGQYAVDVVVVN